MYKKYGFTKVPTKHIMHVQGEAIKTKNNQTHLKISIAKLRLNTDNVSSNIDAITDGPTNTQSIRLNGLYDELAAHHEASDGGGLRIDFILNASSYPTSLRT